MGIAQSLSHMHDLGIVHDGLKTVSRRSSDPHVFIPFIHTPRPRQTFWLTTPVLPVFLASGMRTSSTTPFLRLWN